MRRTRVLGRPGTWLRLGAWICTEMTRRRRDYGFTSLGEHNMMLTVTQH